MIAIELLLTSMEIAYMDQEQQMALNLGYLTEKKMFMHLLTFYLKFVHPQIIQIAINISVSLSSYYNVAMLTFAFNMDQEN